MVINENNIISTIGICIKKKRILPHKLIRGQRDPIHIFILIPGTKAAPINPLSQLILKF